jgi:hypothetical protein
MNREAMINQTVTFRLQNAFAKVKISLLPKPLPEHLDYGFMDTLE